MKSEVGWQTKEAAQRYRSVGNLMIPGRREILEIVADLTFTASSENGVFLDLGCGYGDEAAVILQKVPGLSGVLIDYSDEMVRLAQERFRDNPRIKTVKYDLNEGIPGGFGPASFEAVVSCFMMHHIEFERRVPLYAQIWTLLKPGGMFIVSDRFAEESPRINSWMYDVWVRFMREQAQTKLGNTGTFDEIKTRQLASDIKLGDKPGSLWEMERDLRTAGFAQVDCAYKNQIVAALVAVK